MMGSALNQSARLNENDYEIEKRISFLENAKKQLLDSANFHYTEYVRHLNEANRLQF